MTNQCVQSIEISQELPVENLFNQNVAGLINTHAELMKLPQDPTDPIAPLNTLLNEVGVDTSNDYSMFIMGALGGLGIDVGLSSFGLQTGGALSSGLDFASSLLMDASRNTKNTSTSHKKMGATSMFLKVAKNNAPRRQTVPNTMILKRAMARKKNLTLAHTAKKRAALRKQMAVHMENLKYLAVFKSCGIQHAHKETVQNGQTGEYETHLVAAKDKPHAALSLNGKTYKKPIDVSHIQSARQNLTFAA
jgi:hypothetical protein